SSILDSICVHMVVMGNPDGVEIAQKGIGVITTTKLRNKLYKMSRNTSTSQWKANARGVDINRNFPYKFKKEGKPCPSYYTGKKAGSESETKAIMKLTKKLKPTLKGVVNYHAMGNIVFGSCKKGIAIQGTTTAMYNYARSVSGYASAAGYYSPAGGRGNYREYVMYTEHRPSITIEIGSVACPLPTSQIKPVWKANKKVIIGEAELLSR
nr:hypothetical protein [Lachnospiraceae bacterium]